MAGGGSVQHFAQRAGIPVARHAQANFPGCPYFFHADRDAILGDAVKVAAAVHEGVDRARLPGQFEDAGGQGENRLVAHRDTWFRRFVESNLAVGDASAE